MFKAVLFTHTDLDGIGARVEFELAYDHMKKGEEYEIYMCENATLDDTVNSVITNSELVSPSESTIYFADLCACIPLLCKLRDMGFHVLVFDHHPTNLPALQIYPEAVIKPENALGVKQCGTSLIYQHFCSLNPSDPRIKYFMNKGNQKLHGQFVENVRLYDTYDFKKTNDMKPKHLQALSFMLGTERFVKRYVNRIKSDDSSLMLLDPNDMDFVTAKMEIEQKAIDNFTNNDVYPVTVHTDNGPLRTALVLHTKGAGISELAYQFLSKNPSYDMMANFSLVGQGKFELRTVRNDLDLGNNVAKQIGGGGHPTAAGAPLSQEYREKLVGLLTEALNPAEYRGKEDDDMDNYGIITEGDVYT